MKAEVQDALSTLLMETPEFSEQTSLLAQELERLEGALRVVALTDPSPEWSYGLRVSIVGLAKNTLGEDDT